MREIDGKYRNPDFDRWKNEWVYEEHLASQMVRIFSDYLSGTYNRIDERYFFHLCSTITEENKLNLIKLMKKYDVYYKEWL